MEVFLQASYFGVANAEERLILNVDIEGIVGTCNRIEKSYLVRSTYESRYISQIVGQMKRSILRTSLFSSASVYPTTLLKPSSSSTTIFLSLTLEPSPKPMVKETRRGIRQSSIRQ